MTVLRGVPVSPGRVAGPVLSMPDALPEPELKRLRKSADVADAAAAVETAARLVAEDLDARAERATGTASDLLAVTAAMASDPSLAADAARRVREDRETPARAVWDAAAVIIEQVETLGGGMAERARDVRDVRDRIVAFLTGQRPPGVPEADYPFVLVAGDLAPADAAMLDPRRVLAIVTESGGPTSHTAIMARALGIPSVVSVEGLDELSDGEIVLVDGEQGTIALAPLEEEIATTRTMPRAVRAFSGHGATADGHRVELLANVSTRMGTEAARAAGAEGIGLLRTEFLYYGRPDEPSHAEQVAAYRHAFRAFRGRPVVVRALDAGSDRPLKYLADNPGGLAKSGAKKAKRAAWNGAVEANPAMGLRGLRALRRHADVLDRQLAAIAQAAAGTGAQAHALAPMVSTAEDAAWFAARCAAAGVESAGAMIEVPAAALTSRAVAEACDFVSVGTNDLTSYVMASDRGLGSLAELTSHWQPAVLALIAAACAGAREAGRPASICGEAASDPLLAPVLVGLGATSLSMAPAFLGDVAQALSLMALEQCRSLAHAVLEARTPDEARDLAKTARK